MTKKAAESSATLPGFGPQRVGPGPVYQGVSKQIRRLTASGSYKGLDQVIDPDEHAGTIAAARSLAQAIDRASGHGDPLGKQAAGMQLAAMHAELRELLAVLSPATTESDPFQDLVEELGKLDPVGPRTEP